MRSTPRARTTLAGVALVALAAAAASTVARAASVLDFDVWMRAIDKHSVEVQKNIDAGKPEAATADAQELSRLYGLMTDWFVAGGHAPDAVAMSRAGKAFADAIGPAIAAKNYEAATQAAVELSHACNDCHDNYKPFQ